MCSEVFVLITVLFCATRGDLLFPELSCAELLFYDVLNYSVVMSRIIYSVTRRIIIW
jgi:hypothetical protein